MSLAAARCQRPLGRRQRVVGAAGCDRHPARDHVDLRRVVTGFDRARDQRRGELGLRGVDRARGHAVPPLRSARRARGRRRRRARAHRSIVLARRARARACPTPRSRASARRLARSSARRASASALSSACSSRQRRRGRREQARRFVVLADLLEVVRPPFERVAASRGAASASAAAAARACSACSTCGSVASSTASRISACRKSTAPPTVSSSPALVAAATASPTARNRLLARRRREASSSKSPSTAPAVTTSRSAARQPFERGPRPCRARCATRSCVPPRQRAPLLADVDRARIGGARRAPPRRAAGRRRCAPPRRRRARPAAPRRATRPSSSRDLTPTERLEVEHVGDAVARQRAHDLFGQRRLPGTQRTDDQHALGATPSRGSGSPRGCRDRPRAGRRAGSPRHRAVPRCPARAARHLRARAAAAARRRASGPMASHRPFREHEPEPGVERRHRGVGRVRRAATIARLRTTTLNATGVVTGERPASTASPSCRPSAATSASSRVLPTPPSPTRNTQRGSRRRAPCAPLARAGRARSRGRRRPPPAGLRRSPSPRTSPVCTVTTGGSTDVARAAPGAMIARNEAQIRDRGSWHSWLSRTRWAH